MYSKTAAAAAITGAAVSDSSGYSPDVDHYCTRTRDRSCGDRARCGSSCSSDRDASDSSTPYRFNCGSHKQSSCGWHCCDLQQALRFPK
jgi:hypothetical protein